MSLLQFLLLSVVAGAATGSAVSWMAYFSLRGFYK